MHDKAVGCGSFDIRKLNISQVNAESDEKNEACFWSVEVALVLQFLLYWPT